MQFLLSRLWHANFLEAGAVVIFLINLVLPAHPANVRLRSILQASCVPKKSIIISDASIMEIVALLQDQHINLL